jgi:hypothetical protein
MARGRRRSGGLTTSQRLFGKVAKSCQAERRAGDLPTKADMSSCMREGLRAEGFHTGARKGKRRKR